MNIINKKKLKKESKSWKGLMIDTARHMPSIEYLYKTIDKLSMLGLNKLHLHLSDDQGFRIESKKYPKLNTIGSFRRETVVGRNFPSKWTNYANYIGDGEPYNGYYTQLKLKKIVSYANSKNIDIVPEIDIPGHSTAILASYPKYSAGRPPIETATYWGKFDAGISNTEESIKFLKNIFDEVIEIFNPKYIHIGGDEVNLRNYTSESEVFDILRSVIKHINNRGVKAIVWEEYAKSVIGTDNIVMNWKELTNGYELLKMGANVIICTREYFYFVRNQKDSPNEPLSIGEIITSKKVSDFKIDDSILNNYRDSIIGIQANLWTEYLSTEKLMDYMLYPRLEVFSKIEI